MEFRQSAVEGLGMSQPSWPANFWRGKRVLVTGHSGFKGSWLTLWLSRLGSTVTGISLAPATTPNLYATAGIDKLCQSHLLDIRDAVGLARMVTEVRPEIVFHLAAQPLVRASYRQPLETFATNVMGSAHLLDALRGVDDVRAVVMITTDKVYRNREHPWPYREEDTLGGHDPYSASKAASEIVIDSYRNAFLRQRGVAVASARAGNVIGGGDWSEDRLLPDAIKAWQNGQALVVRNPDAIRPWQHVLEPLAGYLRLAARLCGGAKLAESYNFGPRSDEAATVREVVKLARDTFGIGEVQFGSAAAGPHEAGWLALDIAKARVDLGFKPRWALTQAVSRTMRWYRAQGEGAQAQALCVADIADYEATA